MARKYTIYKKLGRWHVVSGPRPGGIWLWSYASWHEALEAALSGRARHDFG